MKVVSDPLVTPLAATVLQSLTPSLKAEVADFLERRLAGFSQSHEPIELPGYDGEFWVVKPVAEGPTLVITFDEGSGSNGEYVVAAAVPPEDDITAGRGVELSAATRAAIGASVLRQAVVADEAAGAS